MKLKPKARVRPKNVMKKAKEKLTFFQSESEKKHVGHKVLHSTRGVFLFYMLVLTSSFLIGTGIASQVSESKAATTYRISPSGNDSNSCTQSQPCKTMNRGYQVAGAGDTVEMAGGSYGGQTITGSKSSWVYFKPVSGATVTVGSLKTNADFVDISNVTTSGWQIDANNVTDVTLRNVAVKGYLGYSGTGTKRISMYGGSVGPGVDYHPQIAPNAGNGSGWATDLLFDGVYWHDWTRTNSSVHTECLQVAGTTNFTMRNNKFERCAIFDLSFTQYNNSGVPTNVLLENNFFATTTGNGSVNDGFYALNYSDMKGIVMKNNTFGQGINENTGNTGVVLSGNILLSSWQCNSGTHNYNVYQWTSNLNCGTDKWVNGSQYSISKLVTGPVTTAEGLRIDSASPAKDFINSSTASSLGLPNSDIDGNARPAGANYDAGAHEYGSGGGSPAPPPSVPSAPVVTISASPTSLQTGSSSTITWSATNSPSSCTASGDWSGSKSTSGNQSTGNLGTAKTYTYTLACSNAGGSNSASATVNVSSAPPPPPAKPVVSMSVSPSTINQGSSSTVAWSATNSPSTCTASGDWLGNKNASGSQSTGKLNTVKTYTFTLNCTNAGGSTSVSVALVVVPVKPNVTLSLTPDTINEGQSSTLKWTTTNSPNICTASGDWSGDKNTNGGNESTGAISGDTSKTFTLTCSNTGGSRSASATLSISTPEAPIDPNVAKPTVKITAKPETLESGQQATLSWKTTNSPNACTASEGWGGDKDTKGGNENTESLSEGKTYTLTCTNAGGSTSDSVSVSVVTIDANSGEVKVNNQVVPDLKVDNPSIVGEAKAGEEPLSRESTSEKNQTNPLASTSGFLDTTSGKLTFAGVFAGIITALTAGVFYAKSHFAIKLLPGWLFKGRGGGPGDGPVDMISG